MLRPLRFTLTPCRVSFVLCAILAFLTDPDHASHINVADPPTVGAFAPMRRAFTQPRRSP